MAVILPYFLAILGPAIFALIVYIRMNKKLNDVRKDLEDCKHVRLDMHKEPPIKTNKSKSSAVAKVKKSTKVKKIKVKNSDIKNKLTAVLDDKRKSEIAERRSKIADEFKNNSKNENETSAQRNRASILSKLQKNIVSDHGIHSAADQKYMYAKVLAKKYNNNQPKRYSRHGNNKGNKR